MDQTRVVLFGFEGVGDLTRSVRTVLEGARSFDFQIREETFPNAGLATGRPRRFKPAASWRPSLTMLCLPRTCRNQAERALDAVRQQLQGIPVIVATDAIDPEECQELLNLGPDDLITAPFRTIDVLLRLWRLLPRSNACEPVVARLKEKFGLHQLVGESPALLKEIKKIPAVALSEASLLIAGETGTGKEMFARAVHHLSPRSGKPFTPVNCGAIPVELVENELFGHAPGAFTSAQTSSPGLLRETDGGSLFLDEVDCLPLLAQVKLLRFLQEKEFRPLGATKPCRVDVRVIAASNGNLEDAVAKGRFRQDLYYRLNVIQLFLPPLRERKEDIPLLARHFLAQHSSSADTPTRDFTATALQKLLLYDWPGNVRELANVIERSVVLSPRTILQPGDIQLPIPVTLKERESFQSLKAKTITHFERAYLQDILRTHQGNISKAARAAGKHRRAFWEMMRKHQIGIQPRTQISAAPPPQLL